VAVIELKTEFDPDTPTKFPLAPPAPPAPTVTVSGEPVVTATVAVKNPPAPPPPPPPPPPPATTKYSTVDGAPLTEANVKKLLRAANIMACTLE
jgi:hypothetical protein